MLKAANIASLLPAWTRDVFLPCAYQTSFGTRVPNLGGGVLYAAFRIDPLLHTPADYRRVRGGPTGGFKGKYQKCFRFTHVIASEAKCSELARDLPVAVKECTTYGREKN